MDAVFLNNSFLDEMPMFSSEEYSSLEDSEEEDDNVDGFLSTDDEEDLPDIPIHVKNTRSKKEKLDTNLIAQKVRHILDCISSHGLDLPLFLDALSWGYPECHSDRKIQYARTSLLASEELPIILRRWYKPPRSFIEAKGRRPAGAQATLHHFALECVIDKIDQEMKASASHFSSPAKELSEYHLLNTDFVKLMLQAQSHAPTLWQLLHQATSTPKQNHNIVEDPDLASKFY
jgi:hypothetical protein